MRLVIARCTIKYAGRLQTRLPLATRLIMIKADGSIAVHSDGGAYKPLNWMNAPNRLITNQAPGKWHAISPNGCDMLTINIKEILHDTTHNLGANPAPQKTGTEAQLQQLLATNTHLIAENLKLIRREYPTPIGPVDLLCKDTNGHTIAVEIKRTGEINGIEQLTRYLDYLNNDPILKPVRGILVAQTIRPQAKTLANTRHIKYIEVDDNILNDAKPTQPTLF